MKMKFLVLEVCWQILFASIYIDLLRNVSLPDRQLLSAVRGEIFGAYTACLAYAYYNYIGVDLSTSELTSLSLGI